MRTNKLLQGILFLGVFLVGAVSLSAQALLDSYINERVGIWSPLENPTEIGRGDDPWGSIDMPFNFTYDNQSIHTVYAYGNGFISLNTKRSQFGSGVPEFAEFSNLISWYCADLYTTGKLSYEITGTAPFRVLTIQQTGARTFLDFSGATFSAQVKFFETTNEIQIIYGDANGIGGKDIAGAMFFSGSGGRYEYINIKPENPLGSSTIYYYNQNPNTNFWLTTDVKNYLPSGKTYTLSPNPSISGIYPGKDEILVGGNIYEGDNRPYVRINRGASQEEVAVRFKIAGPLPTTNPDYKVVYVAVNEEDELSSELVDVTPQPVGNGVIFRMPHAKDIAGRLSDGALDFVTNEDQIQGGEYEVTAVLELPDVPAFQKVYRTTTNVALSDDIAIIGMESPVSDPGIIYSVSSSIIPVKIRVQNLGRNAVSAFKATAKIYKNSSLVATLEDFNFEDEENPLEIGETMDVRFNDYIPNINNGVGEYTIVANVELLSAGEDKLPANNRFPRVADGDYVFNLGYEIEAEASALVNPTENVYLGAPIIPSVKVKNNGVSDINDANVTLSIVSPSGDVYQKTVTVDAIPHGVVNEAEVFFNQTFIPNEIGIYNVTIAVNALGDENTSNDVMNTTFTVNSGLVGDYYISANEIDEDEDRTFKTLQDAIDTLYLKGVSGDVTFYFFEEDYNIGNINDMEPAWDLSSKIIGIDADHTVTFKAHESVEGTANIYLNSGNGIGILFGQNIAPNNQNAPVQKALESNKKTFSSSNGYFIFDGGNDKQLKFEIVTNSRFKSVFYLANGASNITLKNLKIMGGMNASYDCTLPRYSYDATLGRFTFNPNTNELGNSFTAGIFLRSVPPKTEGSTLNTYTLDTLTNKGNKFDGNFISGFGYGIASVGLGILKDPSNPAYITFYNYNNTYVNNKISDVSRAGIFLGNEYKSTIKNNRIYNVNGLCGNSAAGILLGDNSNSDGFGFHNMEITVDGNEISDIYSDMTAVGIDVMQQMVLFDDLSTVFTFPNMDESILVKNNVIWNFGNNVSTQTGNQKIGVRFAASDNYDEIYTTRNDKVLNNTIVIEDDGLDNPGFVVGAYFYHADNVSFYNNAIANMDDSFDWESSVVGAVFYRGLHPLRGGIKSNNNAYYLPNEDAQIFRFVELDRQLRTLETGYNKEFVELDQWRHWTDQDWSSVEGNFVNDYSVTNSTPPSLRVIDEPAPFNSILNLRGKDLDDVTYDIRAAKRGIAEGKYDIGAYEFNGNMTDRDIELITVVDPGTYKATAPMPFSDVQYVMIPNPEYYGSTVKLLIRNNSDKAVGGIPVTMKEWRESYPQDETEEEFVVEDEMTVTIDRLEPGEEKIVEFNNENFGPKTYAEYRNPNQPYDIPEAYQPLEANVSPIYKYSFHLANDEVITNNEIERKFRFYIQKSNISLLLSVRGIDQNLDPEVNTVNEIASNLNLDKLVEGFFDIGWFVDIEREDPVINIDIFDRDVWEPRSVNYPIYRSLFWVDGHDVDNEGAANTFERYERLSLREFLDAGKINGKKNLVVGSQDYVRNSVDDINKDFVNHYLRAKNFDTGNPLGVGGDYDGKYVNGIVVGRETRNMVQATGYENDDYPQPGLVQVYSDDNTKGSSRIGYIFDSRTGHDPEMGITVPEEERIACVATTTLQTNVLYMGVDWRHWADIETVLRAILDFLENNNGHVIPVELLDFNAQAIADRVEISWRTASEFDLAYFDLERANVIEDKFGSFMNIDNIEAAGNSSTIKTYGPYVDWSVAGGDTYAYRLKSVDKDGEFSYSEPVIVTLDGVNNISISEARPNPVTDNSTIIYELNQSANVFIGVYDLAGNLVSNLVNETKAQGRYELQINASEFASGKYTLVYRVGNSMLTRSLNIVK